MQAVSSVGQSGSCVLLLRDLGTGGDRLPALSPFISSACLKRFSFGCCGCWWFQASPSCLQNVLLSLLPGTQQSHSHGWRASLGQCLHLRDTACRGLGHFPNFHPLLTSNWGFPALFQPCPALCPDFGFQSCSPACCQCSME